MTINKANYEPRGTGIGKLLSIKFFLKKKVNILYYYNRENKKSSKHADA